MTSLLALALSVGTPAAAIGILSVVRWWRRHRAMIRPVSARWISQHEYEKDGDRS